MNLNIDHLNKYKNSLIKMIDIFVKPTEEHMSSIITGGVIALDNKPSTDIIRCLIKI